MKKIAKFQIPMLIIMVVSLLFYYGVLVKFFLDFRYPSIQDWGSVFGAVLVGVIPAALPFAFTLLFEHIYYKLDKWKMVMSISLASVVVAAISLSINFVFILLLTFATPFGSQTDNISNYLVLDSGVKDYDKNADKYYVGDIFPEEIHEEAICLQYFYRFQPGEHYDLYLKLFLPMVDFEAEKSCIAQQYPEAEIVEIEKGLQEYRILYYSFGGYSYKIVAFSHEDLTIEYIDSYSRKEEREGNVPYFVEYRRKLIEEG